jgi:hypothetical protein
MTPDPLRVGERTRLRGSALRAGSEFVATTESGPMSEKPISLLRPRMIEDVMVRNFVEKTRNAAGSRLPPNGNSSD